MISQLEDMKRPQIVTADYHWLKHSICRTTQQFNVQNVQIIANPIGCQILVWFKKLFGDLIKNDLYTYSKIEAIYNKLILVINDSSNDLVLKLEKFSH